MTKACDPCVWFEEYTRLKSNLGEGTILLIRVGRVYLAYDVDAHLVSLVCGFSILMRSKLDGETIRPEVSIPHQDIDAVVAKLARNGHRAVKAHPLEDSGVCRANRTGGITPTPFKWEIVFVVPPQRGSGSSVQFVPLTKEVDYANEPGREVDDETSAPEHRI